MKRKKQRIPLKDKEFTQLVDKMFMSAVNDTTHEDILVRYVVRSQVVRN